MCLCSIVDEPTSHDRFVHVVRWYLSAFHAGRRSSIAKKPYNPVLGEIFRCYYVLQDDGLEKVTSILLTADSVHVIHVVHISLMLVALITFNSCYCV